MKVGRSQPRERGSFASLLVDKGNTRKPLVKHISSNQENPYESSQCVASDDDSHAGKAWMPGRTIALVFVSCLASLVVGALLFGDVDDRWWLYLAPGIPIGVLATRLQASWRLSPLVANSLAGVFLTSFAAIVLHAFWGLTVGYDPITGHVYDEMDHLIPFIEFGVSLIPLGMAVFFKMLSTKR